MTKFSSGESFGCNDEIKMLKHAAEGLEKLST